MDIFKSVFFAEPIPVIMLSIFHLLFYYQPPMIRTRHMGKKKMNKIRSDDSLPMTHHFFVFLIATYKMTVVKHPFRAPSWGLKVDPPSRSSVKKYVRGKLTMGVIKHVEKTRRTRAWRAYHMECKTKSKF